MVSQTQFGLGQDTVHSVAYDRINGLIASGSKDRTIRLWHPTVEGRSTTLKAHTAAVRCVQFSADGRMLISASDDKSLKVWSLPAQRFMFSLTGHSNWVRTCQFSPDGRLVVSGSDDRTVRVWDVATRACIRCYDSHTGTIECVQFHPDGTCIASASSDNSISLWDVRSNQLMQHYTAHTAPVTSLAFHASGNFLISASLDSTLKVWDLREGQLFYTLYGHEGAIHGVAFSPAGDFFASAGADEQVMVWRTNFDRALDGYVLSAVQPAGAPRPPAFAASHAAPEPAPPAAVLSRPQTQQQQAAGPPLESVIAESPVLQPAGTRPKPLAWVLPGTKPTQPPSNSTRSAGGKGSKHSHAAGQTPAPAPNQSETALPPGASETLLFSQAALNRPVLACLSSPTAAMQLQNAPALTSVNSCIRDGLDADIAAAMQTRDSIPAFRPSIAAASPSVAASHAVPQRATGNPFAGSPPKLSPGISPYNQRVAAVRHTPLQAAPSNSEDMPEALASTLQHIVTQLDVLTQTMSLMEERLRLAEDHIATMPLQSTTALPQAGHTPLS